MSVNYTAIVVATAANMMIGFVWYMMIFSKTWGTIHGYDKLSKKEQDEARKGMSPYMVLQLIMTAITAWALAKLNVALAAYSIYTLGLLAWFGFIVPTQVAAVIFGGTEPKWMLHKSLIMASGSLACVMAAAFILKTIG